MHVLLSVSRIMRLGPSASFPFHMMPVPVYSFTHSNIKLYNKVNSLNGELQKWHKIPQEVGLLVLKIFKQLSDGTW